MSADELVESLLYEGYALYPYTPGATKNATPTPFGIAYPPAYARTLQSAHDHLDLRCIVEGDGESPPRCASCCRAASVMSRNHGESRARESSSSATCRRTTLTVSETGEGRRLVAFRVENRTAIAAGALARRGAPLLADLDPPGSACTGGPFVSQLDTPCDSVNTWPVLASPEDDVMVGAAIVLPDHPQIAPESRGNLFDNTEIEEALVLHVHALSDGERAEIEEQDPAVKEMIDRARRPDCTPGGAARPRTAGVTACAIRSPASRRGRRPPCAIPRAVCPRWRWTGSASAAAAA